MPQPRPGPGIGRAERNHFLPGRHRTNRLVDGSLFVCVFTLTALLAAAAPLRLTIDPPWTPKKGLPGNSVFSLLQTRDGYLWVGTGYGLARFDGIHFEVFDENNMPSLKGNHVIKLFEDSRGNLWIGTDAGAVLTVDKQGNVATVEAASSQQARVRSICEDSSGGIWVHTVHAQLGYGPVSRYRDRKADLKLGNDCTALAIDNSGLVWVGTVAGGAGRLIGLGPIPVVPSGIPVPFEIPIGNLDFLLASKSGGYWRLANGRVQKCRGNQVEKDFGAYQWTTPVVSACEDRAGNLVVGTYGDGVRWLDADGKFESLTNLPSSYIFGLCLDREGSLWVATDGGGLNRVRQQVFNVLDASRGLTVRSSCEDSDGGLWIAINSLGARYWKDGVTRQYGRDEGLADSDLPAVFVDRSNQVWAGTAGGLFQLQSNRFELKLPTAVSAIYQDRQGLLWLGTREGLACLDQRKLLTNLLAVQAIAEDRAGNLWVGTANGLSRIRENVVTNTFHLEDGLPSENITALYVDPEDILWVGTSGGLARFDGTHWTKYSHNEGLISDWIGYVAEDREHYLWLGSVAGLMRLKKDELNQLAAGRTRTVACRLYGADDGLPVDECGVCSQPAACAARDGTMWFPTIKGLAFIRPEQIHPNTNQPPVRIESVKVQRELQNTNTLRATAPNSVRIPANKEGLEISYTSLNLAAPERALFKYRLGSAGNEGRWSEPANVRVVQYPQLPPGQYRFQVTACNEDGIWNEAGAVLAITVLPPFWRTPGFLTIASLCLLGLIVGTVHYVSTQRLQQQLARMRQEEALEKERGRIARDLHDQLGANLTQVALLGEMVEADKEQPQEVEQHARQISATARETTHALDEIVWTVNPSNDTVDGLINYVCKYAQDYFALAGLRYRLEVPSELPTTRISPELRHNVFLAAKESINNVVKHSRATSAWLRLHLQPDRFILEIEDNGRGLSPEAEKKGRSGLRNMRKRMEDIGGAFEMGPGAEGGTRIRLMAPLQNSQIED